MNVLLLISFIPLECFCFMGATLTHLKVKGRLQSQRGNEFFTKTDIEKYASLSGLRLKPKVTGPYLSLQLYSAQDDQQLGYLTAFIRPFTGLLQLETIQVKNRRQVLGFHRDSWKIDGPGVSFIMGSWALCWAYENGCKTTELLAVRDTDMMNEILVRLYKRWVFPFLIGSCQIV